MARHMARYPTAALVACTVTAALFFVMQALVRISAAAPPEQPRTPTMLSMVDVEDSPLETRELRPPPERLPPPPPPAQTPRNAEWEEPGQTPIGLPPQRVPEPRERPKPGLAYDGPLVVVIKPQPVYPSRAITQGLDGYVDVEFDVTTAGTVVNPRVIASSHAVFEKAALDAALRFRFKARVVDGVPQPSFGLRNRFTFQMERG